MPRKRSSGDGGLYYLPARKLWRGTYDNGFDANGKRVVRQVHARTQVAARAKLTALINEINTNGAPLDKQTTVSAWSDHWLTTVMRPNLKPSALAAYESLTRTWIVPILGKKKVALLKPSDVRLVSEAIARAGRSSSTALKTFNVLRGMLEAARVDGLCARNVCKDVTTPKKAVSKRGALTYDEARSILRVAQGDPDGVRWWLAILGGLRQSERLGVLLSSLYLDDGVLNVDWTLEEITSEHGCGGTCGLKQGAACPQARLKLPDGFEYIRLAGRLCLVPPKSNKSRTVPLHRDLVRELDKYLRIQKVWPNPHGLLFRNTDGSPIIPKQDNEAWRSVLLRAGVITKDQTEIPTSHWARHTTATVLMELGIDAKIIGEIVGHGSEAVTRGYQHVTSPAAKAAMDKAGDHFALEAATDL